MSGEAKSGQMTDNSLTHSINPGLLSFFVQCTSRNAVDMESLTHHSSHSLARDPMPDPAPPSPTPPNIHYVQYSYTAKHPWFSFILSTNTV
jgi:hypothetical protein